MLSLIFPLIDGPVGRTSLTLDGLGVLALTNLVEDRLDALMTNMEESQADADIKAETAKAAENQFVVSAQREEDMYSPFTLNSMVTTHTWMFFCCSR